MTSCFMKIFVYTFFPIETNFYSLYNFDHYTFGFLVGKEQKVYVGIDNDSIFLT